MTDLTPNIKNLMATHANSLVQASYRLTLNEQRMIVYAAALMRQSTENKDVIRIDLAEFEKAFGLNVVNRDEIRQCVEKLYNRTIYYRDYYTTVKGEERVADWNYRWLDGYATDKKASVGKAEEAGMMWLQFGQKVQPLLSDLGEQFTKIELEHVTRLSSGHTIRLYTVFKQWLAKGCVKLEIGEIRHMLDLQDKYVTLDALKKHVLTPALRQINERTDLHIDVIEQHKRAQKIVAITYRVRTQEAVKAEKLKQLSDEARQQSMSTVRQLLPQSEHLKST